MAAAIVQAALERGCERCEQVVAPDLLDHLRAAYDDDSEVTFDARWDAVRTVDLLALDDFGAQSDTAWAREKLYQLVNYRVNNDLPTVVTSNWTKHEFAPLPQPHRQPPEGRGACPHRRAGCAQRGKIGLRVRKT